jgi:hypothetical protein
VREHRRQGHRFTFVLLERGERMLRDLVVARSAQPGKSYLDLVRERPQYRDLLDGGELCDVPCVVLLCCRKRAWGGADGAS